VLDVIQALSREGMTSAVVTHEMAFARRVADRVLFMDRGRIVDDLVTAEFFAGQTSQRARSFLEQILSH
jgi:ABC-type polar amino acid transport system ATPase subunit